VRKQPEIKMAMSNKTHTQVLRVVVLAAVVGVLGIESAYADGECKTCLRDKLNGLGAKVALDALVGAAGGAAGLLPGAACGAILGATAAGVDALVDVAKCADICAAEAKARSDHSTSCNDLMDKVKQ
jgi:hypothetical protein